MPFYEYECSSCKYYTEVLQKVSDPPLAKCPSCGRKSFKKLISAPVFRLKGSGWYETDFKSDQENKRNLAGADRDESKPADDAKKDAGAKPEAAKAEGGKTEAPKPAAKAGDGKPAARPRRTAASRAKAPARAAAKPAKKKARR